MLQAVSRPLTVALEVVNDFVYMVWVDVTPLIMTEPDMIVFPTTDIFPELHRVPE